MALGLVLISITIIIYSLVYLLNNRSLNEKEWNCWLEGPGKTIVATKIINKLSSKIFVFQLNMHITNLI